MRSNHQARHGQVDTATLGSANLAEIVRLPEGEDLNEWVAVNIADLLKQVRMMYGIVVGDCTAESCPRMSAGYEDMYKRAGQHHEYFWSDSSTNQIVPTTANLYIDYLLNSVSEQLDDENIFPSHIGRSFPSDFISICQSIMCRLFRVYAHVMTAHATKVEQLKATPHVNTSFKQFILFARQFQLIPLDELQPLAHIVERLAPANR